MSSDTRDQMAEHLKFYGELGVAGIRRDPEWRKREEGRGQRETATQAATPMTQDAAPVAQGVTTVAQGVTAVTQGVTTVAQGFSPVAPVAEDLAAIRADIGDCTRCKLCELGRKQIVFGVGNPNADLMFIGEAPGRDEDLQGMPFVGRSGQKLTQIIEAIGLKREDVYIANVIKCRPPENRNPEPDEVETCEQFLFRQVDVVKPKVIVALGTFAARCLLKTDAPISRLRGRVYDYRGAQLIPTFHPAYLLRNPSCRREVWEDMKKARSLLGGGE